MHRSPRRRRRRPAAWIAAVIAPALIVSGANELGPHAHADQPFIQTVGVPHDPGKIRRELVLWREIAVYVNAMRDARADRTAGR